MAVDFAIGNQQSAATALLASDENKNAKGLIRAQRLATQPPRSSSLFMFGVLCLQSHDRFVHELTHSTSNNRQAPAASGTISSQQQHCNISTISQSNIFKSAVVVITALNTPMKRALGRSCRLALNPSYAKFLRLTQTPHHLQPKHDMARYEMRQP